MNYELTMFCFFLFYSQMSTRAQPAPARQAPVAQPAPARQAAPLAPVAAAPSAVGAPGKFHAIFATQIYNNF